MPVPNARILNPFVPRDDLGIEEDISNKLYLPSDVSLSLATMVGRNGRKPRIVQMDDDGRVLVTFGNTQHINGFTEFVTVADHATVNHTDTSQIYDVRGAAYLGVVTVPISTTDISGLVGVSIHALVLDKSTEINSSSVDCPVGVATSLYLNNNEGSLQFGPYIFVEYSFNNAPASAVVDVELYLA